MDQATATAAPSAPGYFTDIPNEVYHAGPGISKSQLDHLNRAPALLQWSRNAPRDNEARAAVDIGDGFHALVLEPDRFEAEYVAEFKPPASGINSVDDLKNALEDRGIAYASKDTRPTLVKKLLDMDPDAPVTDRMREEWAAGVEGRTVLTAAEFRKLQLMRESAYAHPFARVLLEADGDIEPSTYWIDPETGELCRCRHDKIARVGSMRIQVDVKITADIDAFELAIEEYRYHVQDAFYSEGYAQHHGAPADGFVFLAVSSVRDAGRYPVRTFALHPDERLAGREEFRRNLNTYAECRRTGIWPGVETIARRKWARTTP